MQTELFFTCPVSYPNLVEEFFEAYSSCRKNKRNTNQALEFERYLESNLFDLVSNVQKELIS